MKTFRIIIVAMVVAMLVSVPTGASAIYYWICTGYDAANDCNRCSDYFSKPSRDAAEAKCKRMGFPEAMGFPTLRRAFAWERPNCTCPDD